MALTKVEAGPLRHRVTLKREGGTTYDSRGQIDTLVETVSTVWGSVEPLRGQESLLARQLDATLSHKVTVRYSSDIESIGPESWFEINGRRLHIAEVRNIEERNILLECICGETTT
jgi:SPP1 family predicted phage head-tail adaptor